MTSQKPQTMTRAETLARAYAQRLQDCGWKIEVTVEHRAAEMYRHDPSKVMIQGSVFVSVIANGPNRWDDSLGFSWATYIPDADHRAHTRYIGGHLYRHGSLRRHGIKHLSLRALGFQIASIVDMHRFSIDYAAHQGHELGDCISNYKTNQACRHQVDTAATDEQKSLARRQRVLAAER